MGDEEFFEVRCTHAHQKFYVIPEEKDAIPPRDQIRYGYRGEPHHKPCPCIAHMFNRPVQASEIPIDTHEAIRDAFGKAHLFSCMSQIEGSST